MVKLRYGIHQPTGKLICISDILALPDPEVMRGVKSQCICPNPDCGKPLQAKLGSGKEDGGREPHFAHNGAECNVAHATQTALHIRAKEIIQQEKRFFLPPYTVSREMVNLPDIPHDLLEKLPEAYSYPNQKANRLQCDSVELEKRISNIVPDVVAHTPRGDTS